VANTVAANKGKTAPAKSAPAIPFIRAAHKLTYPGQAFTSAALAADPQEFGPFDDPSGGFLRSILLHLKATGGDNGMATVAAAADAPWSAIRSVEHSDVNGRALIYPNISGYDLYLINRYGSYLFGCLPEKYDTFTDVDANGDFEFMLRVPVEIDATDGYGSLPNLSSSDPYRLNITIAKLADIYGTPGDTPPAVAFKQYHENWSLPAEKDYAGNPQTVQPPDMNTTQNWSKTVVPVVQGANTIALKRTGNLLRNLICIFRATGGARTDGDYPDDLTITWDRYQLKKESVAVRRTTMNDVFGTEVAAPAGVYVYPFTEDGSCPGAEKRNLWIPTLQPTEILFDGTFGAAGTLEIITNDVSPVGGR
jgi:hypothetical protein